MPTLRIVLSAPQDQRFKETFFLVEASDFERRCLWEKWNGRVRWEDQTQGCFGQIGTLARRPITLSVFWARIEGRLVGFWELSSQVADYKMANEWFSKNCRPLKWDNGTRVARCDAANFHHCIHAIREANNRKSTDVAS